MVALRRLFQAERGLPIDHNERESRENGLLQCDNRSAKASGPLDGGNCFQQIEKQFEVLHDQLQAQPLSPCSQAPPSRGSIRPKERSPRHVDLLDALFSSHRYHIQSTATLSPITPYNEDIAERNMTRFLQGQPRKRNIYTRLLSALHQEDVADRNMTNPGRRSRSLSRARGGESRGHGSRSSKAEHGLGIELNSPEITSPLSMNDADRHAFNTRGRVSSSLRQQRSAPNLSAERTSTPQGTAIPNPGGLLGVPPAHKQGDTWSNTPLPDSPTIPIGMRQDINMNENRSMHNRSSNSSRDSSSRPSTHRRPPIFPRLGSKKNVRDLSINTELAAHGQPAAKIAHRAIQPPTPNTLEKQNPSIAEVMNSPLPTGTPTSISPAPPSNQKIAEIMDMFRQAYSSSQAITPHPTFETLQEAIIREINSHEAFQRVPPPEQGPPFTPSPSQESFEQGLNTKKTPGRCPSRSNSLRDSQISKLIRRGSFKNHARSKSSEARKGLSSGVSPKAFRRRHTDAPPPSPGFFDTFETKDGRKEEVTYMDLLLKSEKCPANPAPKRYPDTGRPMNRSSPPMPERSKTTPSVLHLRAQTSASSSDSRTSFSADDSDEEVIQLPSVGVPYVQIQGVDENNVSYVSGNTTPRTAYRLMNWPRKSNKSTSLRNRPSSNHSQPTPKIEHRLRGMRSVESC